MICVLAAPISLSLSTVTGVTGGFKAEIPHTITVQAYGTDGLAKTLGGDIFNLKIEQKCSISPANKYCILDPAHDNVPGLPIDVRMQDNGNGTYEQTFMISGGGGTVTVSVSVLEVGGVFAEYFASSANFAYF